MAPLNNRTAAVVDPILSTHARGYRNMEFIGHLLFPRVTIPNRSMRVIKFGRSSIFSGAGAGPCSFCGNPSQGCGC